MTLPVGLAFHTLWSPANRRRLPLFTWLPPVPEGTALPLVLLLHGVNDAGGQIWIQEGRAHETAERLVAEGAVPPFALVIASDTLAELGTGYCDWADGTAHAETHLVDEVLPWAEANLDLNGERSITGLSMGGYGALLTALRHPGLFGAASSMSGFFDPATHFTFIPDRRERMWGDEARMAEHHVGRLLRDGERRRGLRFGFDCGRDDHLIAENRAMHAELDSAGVEHAYAETAGAHEWSVWRTRLPVHLRFLLGTAPRL